jgi:hypothetical protein
MSERSEHVIAKMLPREHLRLRKVVGDLKGGREPSEHRNANKVPLIPLSTGQGVNPLNRERRARAGSARIAMGLQHNNSCVCVLNEK